MSSIGHAASSMLTPMSRFHATQNHGLDLAKHAREYNNIQLSLRSVVGITTNSVNTFDVLPEHHTFVCCAGSAAVLSRVDEHLNITQKLFKAKPNASPVNASTSFYNPATPPSTPGKSRHGSPLKDGGYGIVYSGLSDYPPDSPGQGKANYRSRETSCVSLSRGGNLMAVGETGYNPRVLIFSTASDRPSDVPLSILSDHSFGVSSVAFSHDSRWLCTLGNNHDGFILIYSLNAKTGSAKLHSSNKCSNVHHVSWMGHSVVSIGIRHVKVWRTPVSPSKRTELDNNGIGPPGSPAPKAFAGRSCLLGPLMDATFTSVAAISDCRAIICTAQGDICLLDDSDRTQRLDRIAQVDFGILCVIFDHAYGLVWIGGRAGTTRSLHVETLIKPTIPMVPPITTPPFSSTSSEKAPDTMAIGLVRGRVITVDSHRIIDIQGIADSGRASGFGCDSKRLPAHESAVLGVSSLLPKSRVDGPDFLTFSVRGTVLFWLLDGTCTGSMKIPLGQPTYLEDGDTNDLKIVIPLGPDEHLLSGDTEGVLRLIDRSADTEAAIQAHSGHINGIAVANTEGSTIVATCGRDRTLQLFQKHESQLELFQTLDDHAAAVGDVKFLDGATLLSISSDRTVVVRKIAHGEGHSVAFLPVRVITLKASPVSLTAVPTEPNVVLISTLDRQILRYSVCSGRLLHSFKASDPTSGDSVLMSSLEVHELDDTATASRILLGVSSTDKSIRIHEYDSGAMLTREYGQNTVSAIKLLKRSVEGESPRNHLVSCGLDGTVMTWDLSCSPPKQSGSHDTPNGEKSPSRQLPPSAQPPRRILSKAEISDFQRSFASEGDTVTPIRRPSPSRVRRKTSRYTLAAVPKVVAPALPYPASASLSPLNRRTQRQPSQGHSSTPSSQQRTVTSRSKLPSLDNRRRSKSAANLNDLNDLGKQMCMSLHAFRNRITSSSVAKLEQGTLQALANELNLTIRALNDKTSSKYVGGDATGADVLDVYLAKMIDERLAMRLKSEEIAFGDGPQTEAKDLEGLVDANAGGQERAQDLER